MPRRSITLELFTETLGGMTEGGKTAPASGGAQLKGPGQMIGSTEKDSTLFPVNLCLDNGSYLRENHTGNGQSDIYC